MQIREAKQEELEHIITMGEALQSESQTYEPLLIFNRQESYDHYLGELSNDKARIIVAVNDDDTLMGYQYSYVSELDYLSSRNTECVLEALYVLPAFRGTGIGSALFKNAETWAIETHHVDRIKANIYSNNTASASIHLKDGFEPYCTEYIKFVSNAE